MLGKRMSYNLHLYFQFEEHFKLLIPIPVIITVNDRCKTRNTTVLSRFLTFWNVYCKVISFRI